MDWIANLAVLCLVVLAIVFMWGLSKWQEAMCEAVAETVGSTAET